MSTLIAPAHSWLDYLSSRLSPKAFTRFVAAARLTTSEMMTRVILPDIYNSGSSIAVADNAMTSRDHALSRTWSEFVAVGIADKIAFDQQTFFTNPLQQVDASHPLYKHPSERVRFGNAVTFTFEFDKEDLAFFEQQCAWMRSATGNMIDSKMGELYRELSTYADFMGITVVWSGNKSCHIHISFSTKFLLLTATHLASCNPRDGLAAHWDRLKPIVMRVLEPGTEPDKSLRNPDNYRRLPLGTRIIEPKHRFFGIPPGTRVPQLVMWEKYRNRAAKSVSTLFFSPPLFDAAPAAAKAMANRARSVSTAKALPATYTNDQLEFSADRMRDTFPIGSYPEFSHFEHRASTGWCAMFFTRAGDPRPSSIMKADYAGVKIEGTNPLGLKNGEARLAQTLGESLAIWARRYNEEQNPAYDPFEDGLFDDPDMPWTSTETVILEQGHTVGLSDIEQGFGAEAISHATVATATRRFFCGALRLGTRIWVKGPEGAGKTTQLMVMIPGILAKLHKVKRSHRALFAFTDYKGAREKCDAFNAMPTTKNSNYRGVVVPSFDKLYEDALQALGLNSANDKISSTEAGRRGCSSVWKAVEKYQPEVLAWMADFHEALFDRIAPLDPIFFSVHPVAEQWKECTMSRMMWGRSFWRDYRSHHSDRARRAIEDTHLAFMVHDEIDASKVVARHGAEAVAWVRDLVRNEPGVWKTRKTDLSDCLDSYQRFAGQHLPPVDRLDGAAMTFDLARTIWHLGVDQWTDITLSDDGAYPESNPRKPIYTDCVTNAHKWVVKPRLWWRGKVADYVIVLTTEMLPTACAERADPDGWQIYSIETKLPRDVVDVYLAKSVTARNMVDTCKQYQAMVCPSNPDTVLVVSDSLKGAIVDSRTHTSARGANHYKGKHVIQTLAFLNPTAHEQLLVWNAYTGRDDCVALYHLDRYNQAAGRNIGFRKSGNATHTLVANKRLYEFLLACKGWFFSRYDLVVHLDERQRQHLTTKQPAPAAVPVVIPAVVAPAQAPKREAVTVIIVPPPVLRVVPRPQHEPLSPAQSQARIDAVIAKMTKSGFLTENDQKPRH